MTPQEAYANARKSMIDTSLAHLTARGQKITSEVKSVVDVTVSASLSWFALNAGPLPALWESVTAAVAADASRPNT